MKPKILIITAITIVLFSCHTKREIPENKPQIIQKDFFFFGDKTDRQKTKQLELDSFKTYKELVERIEDLICKDTLPYISWQEENIRKNVFIHTICPNSNKCVLFKRSRIIFSKHDSLIFEKASLNYKNLIDLINQRIKDRGNTEEDDNYFSFWLIYEDNFPPKNILPDIQMLIYTIEQYKPSVHFSISLKSALKDENKRFIPPPPPPSYIPDAKLIDLPLDDEL